MTKSGTTNDNEWYNKLRRMTTCDNEWYNKLQQMTMGDNERQQVKASGHFS